MSKQLEPPHSAHGPPAPAAPGAEPSRAAATTPGDSGAAEVRPGDVRSAESQPAGARSAESRPAESRPAESRSAESRPAESRPAESRPAEPRPAEPRPAEDGRAARKAVLSGTVVSEGIAVGKALVLSDKLRVPRYDIAEADVKRELARFDAALAAGRLHLEQARDQHRESEQTARILEGQMMILADPLFMGEVIQRVSTEHRNAEAVVSDVVEEFAKAFDAMEDPYMRDRGFDVRDVGTRILRSLLGQEPPSLDQVGADTVLVCHQLSPSDMAHLSARKVLGIASEVGGVTSHAAILARSLGIPALVGVADACTLVETGDGVILDGIDGSLRVCPPFEEIAAYTEHRRRIGESREWIMAGAGLEARTKDGVPLAFRANISIPGEVHSISEVGAQGVGLFRTEYLYMSSNRAPTEEDQYQAYKWVVEASRGNPTVIRTLDIGGDKNVPYLGIPNEPNPFLGWRSIRFCLDNPAVFKTQLRAIMRASAHGPVRVMYPMVSTVEEVRQANALLDAVKVDLAREGIAHDASVPVGVMIEVPAAALIADLLAREAAFFSIGTNDLTQYTMAVDRTNERLSNAFDTLSVPVLRLVNMVVSAAACTGIPVSCCGEIASTPEGFMLLLGLGIREFSMNVFTVPQLKQIARHVSTVDAAEVAQRALAATCVEEARTVVSEFARPILASMRPEPAK